MYSITELARVSGVTTRTLRYYDEINLLTPSYTNQAGYRYYGKFELSVLQHILFLKELDLSLTDIRKIIHDDSQHTIPLFEAHYQQLLKKKERLNNIIFLMEQTLLEKKGDIMMTDLEKFDAFKQELVTNNDKQYGEKLNELYQKEHLDMSKHAMLSMSEDTYTHFIFLEKQLLDNLIPDVSVPSHTSETIFNLHREWLTIAWGFYQSDMHLGLSQMYVSDDAFINYYDSRCGTGATLKLQEIISYYIS